LIKFIAFFFGEFARIYQSLKINECFATNIKLSSNVLNFVLKNNIRLIYSVTSVSLRKKRSI